MRLEFTIADTTRPDVTARIKALAQRISERPELVDELELIDDAAIQEMFSEERLAHIAASDAEIDAGNFYTGKQVKVQLTQKHAEWTNRPQH